jgi:cell fate regulator YaaT (PSP1 superfamily)
MIRARVIVRDLGLDMKIGDVEYQGDKRKITFYYTADGRVDFRELIRVFAREYRVKIEMRQIGARQESARIGGIGSCGRELCCSTWLTNFKSVSTVAARYQNLAINQSKLSGQCGRLKCCLNYELNTYLEVLKEFPKNINHLKTKKGNATLIKTDIFKRLMFFAYRTEFGVSEIQALSIEQVKELHERAKQGDLPESLKDVTPSLGFEEEEEIGFVDGAGSLELKQLDRKKRSRNRRNRNKNKARNKETAEPKTRNSGKNQSKDSTSKGSSNPEKRANTNKKRSSRSRGKRNNSNKVKEQTEHTKQKTVNVPKEGSTKNNRSKNKNNNKTASNNNPKNKANSSSPNKKRSRNRNRNRRKNSGQKPTQDKTNVSDNKKD